MMMYELMMAYNNGPMLKEKNVLPKLMHKLSYELWFSKEWILIQITNCQTGEVLATWTQDPNNGVTNVG